MRQTNDGFVIAEEDLRIRGPGEVLGTRQTGGMTLRIADIQRDQAWIEPAQQAATQMLEQASLQNSTEEIELLQQRWIGEKVEYKHA